LPDLVGRSSSRGRCLLDRPVELGDDSEEFGALTVPGKTLRFRIAVKVV
jgi:hypothetical protein